MAPAVRAAERRRNESPLPVPRPPQYWVGTIFSNHDMVVCGDFQWDAIMCWGFGSVSQPGVLCREIGQAHG